ncbi:MAG: histidine kinase [Crocinitomicaceae bacterium]|nr:histidine kinase [Crocinitomicaceae bacterium]
MRTIIFHIIISSLFTLIGNVVYSQNPQYYSYDDENGAPSNTIYSIVQDKRGFLWLGTDAGLYKFDGIKYTSYKCQTQKSKSVSEVKVSESGRVYCINFQSQIFYVENESLKELKYPFKTFRSIPNIETDKHLNLYVNHYGGISKYNEKTKQWKTFKTNGVNTETSYTNYTKAVKVDQDNKVNFLCADGLGQIIHEKLNVVPSDIFSTTAHENCMIVNVNRDVWIFSTFNEKVYHVSNGKFGEIHPPNLLKAIKGKKITNVKYLGGKHLWITTYSGIIKYDFIRDKTEILYPDYAFSDIIIDRENNYWLSSLQYGLFRIPDLQSIVWDKNSSSILNDKFNKISAGDNSIYMGDKRGSVYKLDIPSQQIESILINEGNNIQAFQYLNEEKKLFFGMNSHLYFVNEQNRMDSITDIGPVKFVEKYLSSRIISTSLGCYIYSSENQNQRYLITQDWSRESYVDKTSHRLWLATNKGIILFTMEGGKWVKKQRYLKDQQILSIDFNEATRTLYLLSFNGTIYEINPQLQLKRVARTQEDLQVFKISYYQQQIYVGTNKGLGIYNLKTQKWNVLTKANGLLSDVIENFIIKDAFIWLATNKGLQRIPLQLSKPEKTAILYVNKVKIGNQYGKNFKSLDLEYRQPLTLYTEVSSYASNGQLTYAYRFKDNDNRWYAVQMTDKPLIIPNIPYGKFIIELKVIDHLNMDSLNTITLSGYVAPPFWLSWWFVLLTSLIFILVTYFIIRFQFKKRQKKMDLLYELNRSKLIAIKSQMNPHFIFNVLNSIKSYIYENDKRNAMRYLEDFSDLMRQTLELSEVYYTSLNDEIKLAKIYIELEEMLLSSDFGYTINIDRRININQLKIPALLLQPYIENAFKHGLRHKKGEKRLLLSIDLVNENTIRIEIKDNGIGRKASTEINHKNVNKRKSFATEAMKNRIELINQEGKFLIKLIYVDLFDEFGHCEGTNVIIDLIQ